MSSSLPMVSIVLCTYNGEAFLAPQMDTLLAQTYPSLEILVFDDASTDGTMDLLQAYAARDERIRLHRNTSNLGFNKNFEQAIRQASGSWCAISDQDDLWAPDKIERMMKHTEGCVLVHCDSNMFQTGKQPSAKINAHYRKFEGSDARRNFLYNTFEGHCLLFRKEFALRCMPFPDGVYYDWWLGMNAAADGGVRWVHEVLTFRRLHQFNASSVIYRKEAEEGNRHRQLLKNVMAFLSIRSLPPEHRNWGEELAHHMQTLINGDSSPIEQFLWNNREVVFFYKRNKLLPRWSHRKAIRRFLQR